jgi:hypothetical protein
MWPNPIITYLGSHDDEHTDQTSMISAAMSMDMRLHVRAMNISQWQAHSKAAATCRTTS